jgi:hypothetical protein
MPDDPIKRIPIKDLHQEEGAYELASSPEMEPYIQFAMAEMQGSDATPELEAIPPTAARKTLRVACGFRR